MGAAAHDLASCSLPSTTVPPTSTASLYFSKNPEELHTEFIDACLGAPSPISFRSQKEAFQEILSDTLGDSCDYTIVRQIHENLTELAEEHKEDMEPLARQSPRSVTFWKKSGVEPERLEHFDTVYKEAAGEDTSILVPAITGTGKFAVKTPDGTSRSTQTGWTWWRPVSLRDGAAWSLPGKQRGSQRNACSVGGGPKLGPPPYPSELLSCIHQIFHRLG